jgi:hypothetical protein
VKPDEVLEDSPESAFPEVLRTRETEPTEMESGDEFEKKVVEEY